MQTSKKKYIKLGAVLDNGKGPFLVLGDTKSNNEKYRFDVQIQVRNSKGEVVTKVVNPLISFFDPRKSKQQEGKEPRQVSEKLRFEAFVVEADSSSETA